MADAPPRVAVVIPCHDDGAVVAAAVGSVREAESVEVVVVDDGSTDAVTRAALRDLEAGGTRVLRQANAGPGAARLTGVTATAAPYVYPLDADDLLVEGALAALADALEAAPDAGVAWGDYEVFGAYEGRYPAPRVWQPWSLLYVNEYPICSLLRRSALLRAGGWEVAGSAPGYEDWALWLRFVALGIGGVSAGRVVYRRRLVGGAGRLAASRLRHRELYAALKREHADVFARRDELRALERPPAWKPLVYPWLFGPRAVVPMRVEAFLQRTMMRRSLRLSA